MTATFRPNRRELLAGASAAGLLAALPWPAFAQEPQRGGVLRYATLGLDTADPHRHTGSIAVQQLYVEALTSIASDGSVEPFLAESFEVSEDGKVYTFRLRDGVAFHNGETMTAADVVANIERVKANVTGGWLATAMEFVEKVESTENDVVVMTMSEPYAPLLNLMSELWILSPRSDGWNETITLPIGTGPFRFGEWRPNIALTAPRHETYWRDGMPYLEAVEADLSSVDNQVSALRSGDLHVISVTQEGAKQLASDPTFRVQPLKDSSWYSVAFNNRNPRPPFDNVRVREALCHAIDKTAFIRFAAGDYGVVTNQLVKPGNVYFDQAMHDADRHATAGVEKAKAMLAEAGVDPSAVTIEFVSWQETYPLVIVQMMRKLGFQVNHVALDDLGAQNRLGQYDWDMNCMSSGPRADIFLRYVRLMSDGPNPVLWGGMQDEKFDEIVSAAVAEPDLEKRKRLYLDAWQVVLDNYYVLVLGHGASLIAMRDEVKGYETGFTWSPHWASGGVAQAWLDQA